MLNLTGRVIMISGANRGIGLAVARRLLDGGAKLSLGVRDEIVAASQFGDAQDIILNRYHARDIWVLPNGGSRTRCQLLGRSMGWSIMQGFHSR